MIVKGLQVSIAVMSLVVLLGYTGLLSLGHAGFLAVGAYTFGILVAKYNVNILAAFIIAPIFTTALGALIGIPSFKLKGPFLVVTTIAFGEIVRIVVLNEIDLTDGPFGLRITGLREHFILGNSKGLYILIWILVCLIAIGISRLSVSRLGLALKAIKEDEIAAEIMGVNVRRYKLMSFMISSFLGGLSGVLMACIMRYLNPDSFAFSHSATYLLMTVLGGMSSVTGAIISAVVVTGLPEILRFLSGAMRMVVYSIILLLAIRFSKQIGEFDIKKLFQLNRKVR